MASRVLVTGATGYVGGRLVPCLLQEGYTVRCFVRDPERLRAQPWSDAVEVAVGDALEADTVGPAMEGVEAVYYLIHSLGSGEDAFEDQDRTAATNVRRAAEEAGVKRIVYLGGMRPKGERQSTHLRSRIETGKVLRAGGVPVTEFRAAQIVGSGSLSFELVRYLTERVPLLICPRWVQTPTQPIAVRNVLEYLVAALEQPDSAGEIIEIGGADVLTYAEMFRIYAAVRGLKRWIVHVPFLTPRLSSHWVGFVTPISNSIARPLIEGLDNEVVVDDPSRARRLFPDIDPLPFEAALRLALRRTQAGSIPTVWDSALSSAPRATPDPQLELREGLYREERSVVVDAPPDVAFDTIETLGGETGWLYGDALWRIRGGIDQLFGGVGFRKGRRDDETLRVGDPVDFWRVEAREEDRLLRLRAEMRLPGRAWLQYEVTPRNAEGTRSRVIQTVFFEPKGLLGTLYGTLAQLLHRPLFAGQLQALADRVEQRTPGSPSPPTDAADLTGSP